MRDKVAKKIRKIVYGEQSPNLDARNYFRSKINSMIVADDKRQTYQRLKVEYSRHNVSI